MRMKFLLEDREPPEEAWARLAIGHCCKILAALYESADRCEVFELAKQLKTITSSDAFRIDPTTQEIESTITSYDTLMTCRDPEVEEMTEATFRRGYTHGYIHACDDVAAGADIGTMNNHANALLRWRHQTCKEIEIAPTLKSKAEE
jgi:hypothetical protein